MHTSITSIGSCSRFKTLRAALGEVRYLPHVIELDRAQPEFTRTVWDYMDRTVTPQRIAMGRDKLLLD